MVVFGVGDNHHNFLTMILRQIMTHHRPDHIIKSVSLSPIILRLGADGNMPLGMSFGQKSTAMVVFGVCDDLHNFLTMILHQIVAIPRPEHTIRSVSVSPIISGPDVDGGCHGGKASAERSAMVMVAFEE